MKNKKIIIGVVIAILLVGAVVIAITQMNKPKENKSIIIGSTTSLQDSGLLDVLLPMFTQDTGIETKVIAVGTGQAIQMGRDGEVDVLLVHDKSAEETFVQEGHGAKRWNVMYNDFVLVGPKDDTFDISAQAQGNITKAFIAIGAENAPFISRGDDSGTHKKELSFWKKSAIEPTFSAYISAGKGMGDVLKMADELFAYTLTDRGTYMKLSDSLDLQVLVEGDEDLLNMYGVIAVDPSKNKLINDKGAQVFIEWLLSDEIQKKIGEYGVDTYGKPLFNPCGDPYK